MSANKDSVEERILIDLNPEITAKIDVLVEKGLYPDKKEFLEQAIRAQLNIHQETFQELERVQNFVMGIVNFSAEDLEKTVAKGKKRVIKVVGRLSFSSNVTPELIDRSIDKIIIAGILKAPSNVMETLNSKRYSILGSKYTESHRLTSRTEE